MLAQYALHGGTRYAEQVGELGGGALAGVGLGDDLGALGTGKARPSSKVPPRLTRVGKPVHGPLADHGALELGERA